MTLLESYRHRTPGSEALHRRGLDLFPGGVSHNLRAFSPHPLYPRSAAGSRFKDVDGHTFLDLWMGHYALILGHAFEPVRRALADALSGGWHWGMPSEGQVLLGETLRAAVPSMEEMRFCTTGTEAAMYAVRLARAVTGKSVVLKAAGGWHGASTDLSFAVRPPYGDAEGPGLLPPGEQGMAHVLFNDVEGSVPAVEANRGKIAAVIVEPMLGAGGFLPATPAFLAFLREVCDGEGALLIFDEIITGFRFRYGSLADEYGVCPDLTTLGKIVGGGLPLGVYGGRRDVMEAANPSSRGTGRPVLVGGGTFSCHPLTLAAARAQLGALEQAGAGFYANLARRGEALRRGVEERFSAAGLPAECTGKGSLFMTHVLAGESRGLRTPADLASKTRGELPDGALRLALLNHGVFAVHGGGALSSAHSDGDVDTLLEAYGAAAEDLKRELAV